MKFQVMDGKHHVYTSSGDDIPQVDVATYPKGSVVESDQNLARRLGPKFKRVLDDTPASVNPVGSASPPPRGEVKEQILEEPLSAPVDLSPPDSPDRYTGLTVAELKAAAKTEGVDLGSATTKSHILEALRGQPV